jgi:ABC-2 type transport system ATP-binding protein
LSQPAAPETLDRLGTVVSIEGNQVVLSVAAAQLSGVVRDVLAALPVVDLTVEDPPLEEVMRELFRGQPRDKAKAGDARDDDARAQG